MTTRVGLTCGHARRPLSPGSKSQDVVLPYAQLRRRHTALHVYRGQLLTTVWCVEGKRGQSYKARLLIGMHSSESESRRHTGISP